MSNEPVYKTEQTEESIKAACRLACKKAIREIVSWNGLSARTRNEVIKAFGNLYHKNPKRELDVYWCFDKKEFEDA